MLARVRLAEYPGSVVWTDGVHTHGRVTIWANGQGTATMVEVHIPERPGYHAGRVRAPWDRVLRTHEDPPDDATGGEQ